MSLDKPTRDPTVKWKEAKDMGKEGKGKKKEEEREKEE
jgi:hypothetical protein